MIRKPVNTHGDLDNLPLIINGVSASSHSDKWSCFICGSRRQRNLKLATCARIPRHIAGFNPEPDSYILTLVCSSCVSCDASVDVVEGRKEPIFMRRRQGVRGTESPVVELGI